MLHALRGEADPRTIALAVVRLYHEAAGNTVDETEIPEFVQRDRPERKFEPRQRAPASGSPRAHRATRPTSRRSSTSASGRKAGIRPDDLVGCIANETDLIGREIGPIRITEKFSVVGVPEGRLDEGDRPVEAHGDPGKAAQVRQYVDNPLQAVRGQEAIREPVRQSRRQADLLSQFGAAAGGQHQPALHEQLQPVHRHRLLDPLLARLEHATRRRSPCRAAAHR